MDFLFEKLPKPTTYLSVPYKKNLPATELRLGRHSTYVYLSKTENCHHRYQNMVQLKPFITAPKMVEQTKHFL